MLVLSENPIIARRQRIEERIIRKVVQDAHKAGYVLRVFNGEETTGALLTEAAVMDELFECDEEYLELLEVQSHILAGWVFLVHGNGTDVIADYSVSLTALLNDAIVLADHLLLEE